MMQTQTNGVLPMSDEEKRIQIRIGMKLVLEDRILKAARTKDMTPVYESLNYIHFDYENGFTVTLMVTGFIMIDGVLYTGKDGVMMVKDGNKLLFTLYVDKKTNCISMTYNDYDLMTADEQAFHQQMNDLLNESKKRKD